MDPTDVATTVEILQVYQTFIGTVPSETLQQQKFYRFIKPIFLRGNVFATTVEILQVYQTLVVLVQHAYRYNSRNFIGLSNPFEQLFGVHGYNSRNFIGLSNPHLHRHLLLGYNSRNFIGLSNQSVVQGLDLGYNSRNFIGLSNLAFFRFFDGATTVEILQVYQTENSTDDSKWSYNSRNFIGLSNQRRSNHGLQQLQQQKFYRFIKPLWLQLILLSYNSRNFIGLSNHLINQLVHYATTVEILQVYQTLSIQCLQTYLQQQKFYRFIKLLCMLEFPFIYNSRNFIGLSNLVDCVLSSNLQQQKFYRFIKPITEFRSDIIYNSRNFIGLSNQKQYQKLWFYLQQQKFYRFIKP